DPGEGDRQDPDARRIPAADAAGSAGLARRARGRRPVAGPRCGSTAPAHARGRAAVAAAGSTRATTPGDLRGPPLDRWRDPGRPRQPRGEPAARAPPAARELPARVPTRLGQQDLLPPAPD